MNVFFLTLSFSLIFCIFLFSSKKMGAVFTNLRLAFVKSSLVISLLVAFFTEALSFFKLLTFSYLSLLWFIVFVASLIALVFIFKKNTYSLEKLNLKKLLFFKNEPWIIKSALLLILIILLALTYIAFTVNNNWDSYTYHLPRVEHWIQDKNVDFYPTNNIRQLYLAPFAEYFVLNLRLLSGNALFVNFVQFFSFLNCLLLASLIAKALNLSKKGQLTASILALTIPMGVLQSVTTQTDLVVSFFLISFVYFGISIIKEKNFFTSNLVFLAVSFSLGILTKSTFYIFALPFCIFFGIYYLKSFKLKSFYILSFLIITFLITNFSFLWRNHQQFGSVLGPQKTATYYQPNLNTDFGIKPMLSNSIKNIGMHLVLPSEHYNKQLMGVIVKFHELLNYPLNSAQTNWRNMPYALSFNLSPDSVGNFLSIILCFIALIVVITNLKLSSKLVLPYSFSLSSSFFLFAFVLVWQPWQARLDLPFFILAAPLIAYALSLLKQKNITLLISCALLCSITMLIYILDPTKPILGDNSIVRKDQQQFIISYDTAKKIEKKLNREKIKSVGLALGEDTPEWQYWLVSKNRRFKYVHFPKDLTSTPNFDPNFSYRALISDQKIDLNHNENISEIINIDKTTTLIIYKNPQTALYTHE